MTNLHVLLAVFTFHYVSINSKHFRAEKSLKIDLHSTMYLLIRCCTSLCYNCLRNLHSTMYLLIPASFLLFASACARFTFHYVSINSTLCQPLQLAYSYLHSTMYLLIPCKDGIVAVLPIFTFHYVSINSVLHSSLVSVTVLFTFHYVSINSSIISTCRSCLYIYIPLCIY